MKASVKREGIEADDAVLVERLWPSATGDHLDDVRDDPGQGGKTVSGGFKFGRKHRSHALIEVVDGKDVQTIVRGGAGAN